MIENLEPLVGDWEVEVTFPGQEPASIEGAISTFEWMKGENLLIQRTTIPETAVPDSFCFYSFEPDKDRFLQHYFDSRGVIRLYEMEFANNIWTLLRNTPDFSPLDFSQRFTGELDVSGDEIRGKWEKAYDHVTWELDFDLTYRRMK